MKTSYFDLLLHPIRMGIVQNLIGGRRLSTQQLSELLPHVPQATLYRHLNKLLREGFISVVEENQVRGTVEKVYSLNESSLAAANEESAVLTADEYKQYFFTYMVGLMDELERYFDRGDVDVIEDGLSYRQGKYYMTDEEYSVFINDLQRTFEKVVTNMPSPDRKARTIGFVMIPDGNVPGNESEKRRRMPEQK